MAADADTTVRISKTIPAPPEAVFRAWTEPAQVSRWFAPPGARVAEATIALAPGGAWKVGIEDGEGVVHTAFGVYREIRAPERLVLTWDWEGENSVGETEVTVAFEAEGGATRLDLTHAGLPSAESAEGHRQGWSACLDLLAGLFEG